MTAMSYSFADPLVLALLLASAGALAQGPMPAGPDESAPPALLTEPAESPAPRLFVPLAIDPNAAPASSKTRLLVLDVIDKGAGSQLTSAIQEAVAQEAIRSYVGEAITSAQLKTALSATGLQQLMGCESEACMSELGETADAERVLGGSAAKVGDDVVLTLLLVEGRTGKRLSQEQRKVPATGGLPFYAAKQLTSLLLTGRVNDPLVPVVVRSSQPGAKVLVDGKLLGEAPVTLQLDAGRHELKVSKEGFSPWKALVDVEEASPVQVDARLVATRAPLWPLTAASAAVSVGNPAVINGRAPAVTRTEPGGSGEKA
jgi:hypothetical protein